MTPNIDSNAPAYGFPANMPLNANQPMQPRNALLQGDRNAQNTPPNPRGALVPELQRSLLSNVIGHAAVLSDTPEKWATTIDLLKQLGVDPAGYEDFGKGRKLAIAESGRGALHRESSEPSPEGE